MHAIYTCRSDYYSDRTSGEIVGFLSVWSFVCFIVNRILLSNLYFLEQFFFSADSSEHWVIDGFWFHLFAIKWWTLKLLHFFPLWFETVSFQICPSQFRSHAKRNTWHSIPSNFHNKKNTRAFFSCHYFCLSSWLHSFHQLWTPKTRRSQFTVLIAIYSNNFIRFSVCFQTNNNISFSVFMHKRRTTELNVCFSNQWNEQIEKSEKNRFPKLNCKIANGN